MTHSKKQITIDAVHSTTVIFYLIEPLKSQVFSALNKISIILKSS